MVVAKKKKIKRPRGKFMLVCGDQIINASIPLDEAVEEVEQLVDVDGEDHTDYRIYELAGVYKLEPYTVRLEPVKLVDLSD